MSSTYWVCLKCLHFVYLTPLYYSANSYWLSWLGVLGEVVTVGGVISKDPGLFEFGPVSPLSSRGVAKHATGKPKHRLETGNYYLTTRLSGCWLGPTLAKLSECAPEHITLMMWSPRPRVKVAQEFLAPSNHIRICSFLKGGDRALGGGRRWG